MRAISSARAASRASRSGWQRRRLAAGIVRCAELVFRHPLTAHDPKLGELIALLPRSDERHDRSHHTYGTGNQE
jgi:hypothetical protein